MVNNQWNIPKQLLQGRLFYFFVLMVLLYHIIEGAMLHNISNSGFFDIAFDKTYWVWILTGIPQLITHHIYLSRGVDVVLLILVIACMYQPSHVLLCRLFWITFLVFYLTLNLYCNSHFKPGIAILMVGFTFWFKKEDDKLLWWKFARYYFLFVYVSSAIWKIYRGGFIAEGWFSSMIVDENLQSFYLHGFSSYKNILWWLIQHHQVADFFYKTGIVLEASFIIGFFTQKFDGLLLLVSLILHFSISLLLGIHIYWLEFQVFYITLYWSGFQRIAVYINRIFIPEVNENR